MSTRDSFSDAYAALSGQAHTALSGQALNALSGQALKAIFQMNKYLYRESAFTVVTVRSRDFKVPL